MIPFNKPYLTGNESRYITEALRNGTLSGDGSFTQKCQTWLEKYTKTKKALLTHSCTAALEMAALLVNIKPADEIIMPSFTFVSTANAFVLRGGIPVFVDVREDTFNIDEKLIEQAITKKTKAIVVVHYAGVSCEMNTIMAIAKKHNLYVIEDAAQALGAHYNNQALGSIGHLATLSFHATKNIIAGEGGALLINDPEFIHRAEIIREKGTNRSQYCRKEINKYHWMDVGSSYLPSELTAAFLYAQLEQANYITQERLKVWNYYQTALKQLTHENIFQQPVVPKNCEHNGHIYYLLCNNEFTRNNLITHLKEKKINSTFHYLPLHLSPAGKLYTRQSGLLKITERTANTLIRLPVWAGLSKKNLSDISHHIFSYFIHKETLS